jgi:hypothetical protein
MGDMRVYRVYLDREMLDLARLQVEFVLEAVPPQQSVCMQLLLKGGGGVGAFIGDARTSIA